MAKAQVKKKKARVDMTAMCDVAFLLLTFFVMTSTVRLPDPYPVDTPASTVQTKLPDTNLATITVGDNVAFFGLSPSNKEERKIMLEKMAAQYGLTFTPEQIDAFSLIDAFGTDIRLLGQYIALRGDDRSNPEKYTELKQGIPFDSTNNQLADWVYNARLAVKEVSNLDLEIAIRGDAKVNFPSVKRVIDILQKQDKNNFFLVTSLRSDDF